MNYRQQVVKLMTERHAIRRDLAELHVAQMSEEEVRERFCRYTGTELSVVERNPQSEPDFYQVFGFATATARSAALNPVPELPTEYESRQESARAGNKKPGPMVGRAVSAGH